MNFSRAWLTEDFLHDFDLDLQTFYYHALLKEVDLSSPASVSSVKQALREVVNAYRKDTVNSHASNIEFDTPEKRCAYVMKHCPCFSSAVARHFLQMLRANPFALDDAFRRRRINLCCLGGGPATDAVAIARIINAINGYSMIRNESRLRLVVWIVDLSQNWRKTASLVLQTLEETGGFCDREKMALEFRFLRADLTEPWRKQLRDVLGEADIITTVYFVSAVNGSKVKDKCLGMLQNIMGVLKPGALLFFLDSAKDLHYGSVLSAASSFKDLKQIYGPLLQIFHTLSYKSIRRYIELYFLHFNALLCLTNCFITSCGWTKERIDPESMNRRLTEISLSRVNGLSSPCEKQKQTILSDCNQIRNKGRKWHKTVTRNTKRQERFRERVEQLLLSAIHMDFAIDDLNDPDIPFEQDCLTCDGQVFNATKSKRKRIYAWPE